LWISQGEIGLNLGSSVSIVIDFSSSLPFDSIFASITVSVVGDVISVEAQNSDSQWFNASALIVDYPIQILPNQVETVIRIANTWLAKYLILNTLYFPFDLTQQQIRDNFGNEYLASLITTPASNATAPVCKSTPTSSSVIVPIGSVLFVTIALAIFFCCGRNNYSQLSGKENTKV
jgi:hypothetical protein